MNAPVITVTATIMDGTVVRWFDSLDAAERNDPVVSASRTMVVRHRKPVPAEWDAAAQEVFRTLDYDRNFDLRYMATHICEHPLSFNSRLIPVARGESS